MPIIRTKRNNFSARDEAPEVHWSGKLPERNKSDWPLPHHDDHDPSLTDNRPVYQYATLADSPPSIRLIRFRLGSQTLHLSIKHFSVLSAPQYAALSYVWGTQYAPSSVRVEEEVLHITQNCWYALRQLHRTTAYEWFWIDAISIDQKNLEEKSAQISLMGNIYRNAGTVYVSLGANGVDSEHLFQHIDNFDPQHPVQEFDLSDYRALQGLLEIAYAEYWSRLWICQEFALAKAIVVLRGDSFVSWHYVRQFMEHVANNESRIRVSPDLLDELRSRFPEFQGFPDLLVREAQLVVRAEHKFRGKELRESPMWSTMELKTSQTILDALRITQTRRCSESKDRVFGILQLVSWPSDPIKADYTQSELALAIQIVSRVSEDHVAKHFKSDPLFASISVILRALDLNIDHAQYIEQIRRRCQFSELEFREPKRFRSYALGEVTSALHEVASWSHTEDQMHVFIGTQGDHLFYHKSKIIGPETDLRAGDVLVWDTEPCEGHHYRLHFILRKARGLLYSIVAYLREYENHGIHTLGQRIVVFMDHEDLFVWYYLSMVSMKVLKRQRLRRIKICRAFMSSYAVRIWSMDYLDDHNEDLHKNA